MNRKKQNVLTQKFSFSTPVSDCDSHSPALLNSFLSFLLCNGFSSIGKFWSCCCLSFHRLSIKLKLGCPFSLHSLWLFLWILGWSLWSIGRSLEAAEVSASAASNEFCEWGKVGIDVYVPHCKYQIKPQLSRWFSAAYAAAIVYRNHFFVCTNRINLLTLKIKLRHDSNHSKRVPEAAKFAYSHKTKQSVFSQRLGSQDFSQDELLKVFSGKVNLLYLLY